MDIPGAGLVASIGRVFALRRAHGRVVLRDDPWGSFRQSKLRRLLRLLSPCLEMLAATAFPGSAAVISRHEAHSSGFWFPSSACYLVVCGFWHRLFVVVTPRTFSLTPWSFGGMVSQCRVAFCVSADVILEGSGRLSLSSSGGRVSFWTRALHGCLYISRPGGRARFVGPACGGRGRAAGTRGVPSSPP